MIKFFLFLTLIFIFIDVTASHQSPETGLNLSIYALPSPQLPGFYPHVEFYCISGTVYIALTEDNGDDGVGLGISIVRSNKGQIMTCKEKEK